MEKKQGHEDITELQRKSQQIINSIIYAGLVFPTLLRA
jgi:hypothetical protein